MRTARTVGQLQEWLHTAAARTAEPPYESVRTTERTAFGLAAAPGPRQSSRAGPQVAPERCHTTLLGWWKTTAWNRGGTRPLPPYLLRATD